jgi:hypothetical protein
MTWGRPRADETARGAGPIVERPNDTFEKGLDQPMDMQNHVAVNGDLSKKTPGSVQRGQHEKPQDPRAWRSKDHSMTGVSAKSLFLGGAACIAITGLVWLCASSGGATDASPEAAEEIQEHIAASVPSPAPPVIPQKTLAEIQHERKVQATLITRNGICGIEADIHNQFGYYDKHLATALVRRYGEVQTADVDYELCAWIKELIAAAQTVIDGEKERQTALRQLDVNSDARIRDAVLEGAKFGSESGETTRKQIGRGILGALAGALLGNIDTDLRRQAINDRYDQLEIGNGSALKTVHANGVEIINRLDRRYGWSVVVPAEDSDPTPQK